VVVRIITFITSIVIVVAGYFIYASYLDRIFGSDGKIATPVSRLADGVDYVPLPEWKIFMIQLLNIAGLGPIFGALAGAMFGPVVFLWIVFGSLFIGGVHDYFSGMISLRHDGKSLTELIGLYLGSSWSKFTVVFITILMVLVGVVFVKGPAEIMAIMTGVDKSIWFYIIFAYYLVATLFPIDQIIGRIYPFFAVALIIMVVGLASYMFINWVPIAELTFDSMRNMHVDAANMPIFPVLFITIACGAVSGFHATQSPLMARCMLSETQGKRVFFGAMSAEAVIAIIWAAAGMCFFGDVASLNREMVAHGNNPVWLVNLICNTWLGKFGGALAILGVVACPVTTGDTAFRGARLILADALKYSQKPMKNRLIICVPIFFVSYVLAFVDFGVIWRYFAWFNQSLSVMMLWTASAYMIKNGKPHWFSTIPAILMTFICSVYILSAKNAFALKTELAYLIGLLFTALIVWSFFAMIKSSEKNSGPVPKISENMA